MNSSVDLLCDLWMALYQFSDRDDVEDKAFNALIETMDAIEKALILKLQNEVPNITKILAILTNFGASELPHSMDSLLKAYEPSLESPIKKVA
ncbi:MULTISPECIES: hypothetical protein [unclassified Bartonella]|uniref:hypothetical protein n=1 Tax=unclassified Bartonella TaxID=2645622 RepID=UPI0035CFFA5B